jgi:ATP-binding cassette subfamily B (MDR/TAP) protein 1
MILVSSFADLASQINRNGIDSGKIITVFLSILIGSFSMAMLAPEMEAIGKARGGAAKLYETIDRVPSIDTGSEEGDRLETVEGRITFENVHFVYPARRDVPILKGLNLEFLPGQTVALVGASGSGKSTGEHRSALF